MVFKAVANDRRICLIKLLNRRGRMSLREIVDVMDIPEATACRNLKILENADLVKSEIKNSLAEYWLNKYDSLFLNKAVLNMILR